jgi:rhamnose utilization protein RhaD (predicted bifunctional aldolase and dehydrogenase)
MTTVEQTKGEQVRAFCDRIGKDPLLVQGAGGNVSWKDGDVLWVKASGTWLSDAIGKDIFVPVELAHLRQAIANQDFQVIPKVVGNSKLRPSIETLLHALMPHNVVVHLHAVEILAHLVRADPEAEFKKLIGGAIKWTCVDYFKPGAELAASVAENLLKYSDADVVFLCNHGVVIGGASITHIEIILQKLVLLLKNTITPVLRNSSTNESATLVQSQYYLCSDQELNQLATNNYLSARLEHEWVLYPDHAVFLGSQAAILGHSITLEKLHNMTDNKPAFVFDMGKGIYESKTATFAQKAQLRCYYDVLIRQPVNKKLVSLSPSSIIELLDWDAEKYRKLQSGDEVLDV